MEPSIATVIITGLVLVFAILVLLYLIITLQGKIFVSIDNKKKAKTEAAKAAPAPAAKAAPPWPPCPRGRSPCAASPRRPRGRTAGALRQCIPTLNHFKRGDD